MIPLENCSSRNFFGLLTDIFDNFWIQVAVSLPKPAVLLPCHSRFASETVINLQRQYATAIPQRNEVPVGAQRFCNGRSGVLKSTVLSLDRGLPFPRFPPDYFTLGVCMGTLCPDWPDYSKNHISRTKRNYNILRTVPGTLWERQGALATFLGAVSGPSARKSYSSPRGV